MHQPLIIQHLFQVSTLEDVSRERLESFVESYPSFGIGHYLLSCKLQAEGSDRFLPETQRTCLYFSNPLWLQWLLQNSDASVATQPVGSGSPAAGVAESVGAVESGALESVTSLSQEAPVAGPVWEQAGEMPIETAPAEATYAEAHTEATYLETSTETTYTAAPAEATDAAAPIADTPVETPESPVENVVTMAEEAFAGPAAAGDDLAESLTASEATSNGEGLSAAEQLLRSIEEAKELRESLQKLQADGTGETAIAGESLPAETEAIAEPLTEPAAALEPTAPQEEPIRDEEVPFVLEEREERPATEGVAAPAETPAPAEKPAPAETPAEAEASKQTVTATQDFLFEPYHTIDYFASQGIKLTVDENPTDTLGKQLKSFTDWLKTMRRLPQKDREVVPDRVAEQAVQTSAAHSVLGKDVVTETMAEVLAKQGMREKARAVYEKLSLLNPDKRAYFAAKIEQLNIP